MHAYSQLNLQVYSCTYICMHTKIRKHGCTITHIDMHAHTHINKHAHIYT